MIEMGVVYSFGVFLKPILGEFAWTRAMISGASSLNMILSGAAGIIAGRINDRFGPRIIITICGFIMATGSTLMSQVNTLWQIYLCYGVVMGIGTGSIFVSILSTVARWFEKGRGTASGIALAGGGIGVVIIPPLAHQLISSYGWRISFIIIGSVVLMITVGIAQFLKYAPDYSSVTDPEHGIAHMKSSDTKVRGFSFRETLGKIEFWIVCILFFCGGFCIQSVMIHIVPHATDTGISPGSAATILSAIGIISIASKIGMGCINDKIGGKLIIVLVYSIMKFAFLWFQIAVELWMLYLFAVVFALGYGGFSACMSPIIAEFFGLREHGALLGIALFIMQAGGAIGTVITGWIFDISSYYWAFALCALLCLANLIMFLPSLKAPTHK